MGAKNPKSLSLRTHSQTSGWSLTAQDPFNNVARTCIEAMAATQGHTQSLHTNALDEAIALPTDFSARIARNTQLLLQQESGTTAHHRPLGRLVLRREAHPRPGRTGPGNTSRRSRTPAAWPRPSRPAFPKLRIEEAAARTQARIDSGTQAVIGVNTLPGRRRRASPGRAQGRQPRGPGGPDRASSSRCAPSGTAPRFCGALAALTERPPEPGTPPPAATCRNNLLALAVDAARAKATVGEISDALEKVCGRHTAVIRTISGVYRAEAGDSAR